MHANIAQSEPNTYWPTPGWPHNLLGSPRRHPEDSPGDPLGYSPEDPPTYHPEDPPGDPLGGPPEDPPEDPREDPPRETLEDLAKDPPENPLEDPPEDPRKDPPEDPLKDPPGDDSPTENNKFLNLLLRNQLGNHARSIWLIALHILVPLSSKMVRKKPRYDNVSAGLWRASISLSENWR